MDGTDRIDRIGPYRLLDVLGEGGMSIVYLAEQSEPVKRRVALKIIKLGMDTAQVIARFESERQALAVMDHPNIAHVLDGGETVTGRPYFVMERVHGVSITDYCDTHRLSTEERVILLLDVCAAIQHAHQKGVVHRDLKPSNILVGVQDGRAVVKVIDFGIAKAMGHSLTDRTLVTRVGQMLGTPAYMSPEQAGSHDLDVDTRSDIYSLGVVLYELLTGTLPLQLEHVADHALRDALRDTDVVSPSRRVSTLGDSSDAIARHRQTDRATLDRELRGDLDSIVLKAMEKDRSRRYDTVEAFAADLRRHVAHEPVLARPRSAGYVFTRFIRRHKAGVAAGAIAILALAVGAVLATMGFVRATRAEQDARREAQTAERTAEFMVDLFEVSDPSEARGNTITAREILDRGAERIRTELADQPDVQSNLMNTIGLVYKKLALFDLSKQLLTESLAIRRATFGNNDARLLPSLISLGELNYRTHNVDDAERLFREALALAQSVVGPDSLAAAEAMSDLGLVLNDPLRQASAEAVELYRRALPIYEREQGESEDVRTIRSNLAYALLGDRKVAEAEALLRETLARTRTAEGTLGPGYAQGTLLLAEVVSMDGRLAESEQLLRECIATQLHTLGPDHVDVANAKRNLALVLMGERRYAEPETLLQDAERIWVDAFHGDNLRIAQTRADLGMLLMVTRRYDEADAQLRDAIGMLQRLYGDANQFTGTMRVRLAELDVRDGKPGEALELVATARPAIAGKNVTLAYASSVQAAALAALGRVNEAQSLESAMRPAPAPSSLLERMSMARALELYSAWAPRDATARYESNLTTAGFLPVGNVSAATQ